MMMVLFVQTASQAHKAESGIYLTDSDDDDADGADDGQAGPIQGATR